MNLEKRFIAIKIFLKDHQSLLDTEVLECFPFKENKYLHWLDDIKHLNATELIELENDLSEERINNIEYKQFLNEIKKLKEIPLLDISQKKIPKILNKKLSQKKQHEIVQILDLIEKSNSENFIDIGSGAGHLSSILLYNNNKHSLCIDAEKSYQDIGFKKLKRDAPEILTRIDFKTQIFSSAEKLPKINNCTLIGLHSCGNLSVDLIKSYTNSKLDELLNFGCCYHKLDNDHINISKQAKQTPLRLTNHALTMAAKSFKRLNQNEYQTREKVKSFRYTLHLLMKEKFNQGFTTLGNASKADYNGSFTDYVYKYFPTAKKLSKNQVESFYEENSNNVRSIILMGIIRSHLSRLTELYIILDRALYLEENGFSVEIKECFNKELSPRNISIQAFRNEKACSKSRP